MREFKVTVMGAGGVGKSSLTSRYVSGTFVEAYDPTIEDSFRKEVVIDGNQVSLEIVDTAGLEQFAAMRELYIRNSDGFILVFDVTSQSSLAELEPLQQQIRQIKDDKNVPVVVVANKCDETPAFVLPKTALRTSAKLDEGVAQAFATIVRVMTRRDSALGHSLHNQSISTSSSVDNHSLWSISELGERRKQPARFRSSANLHIKRSMARIRSSKSLRKLVSIASFHPTAKTSPAEAEETAEEEARLNAGLPTPDSLQVTQQDLAQAPEIVTIPRKRSRGVCIVM